MTKLSDIQSILLSAASQRDDGSLLPLPDSLAGKDEPARKAVLQLIKRGLAAEAETSDRAVIFREEGDLRFAAVITEAGKQTIGAVDAGNDVTPVIPVNKEPRKETKQSKIIELLERDQGASIVEMQKATGWLPHTTRAALTGIRKRGLTIEKSKVDGETRYKAVTAQ